MGAPSFDLFTLHQGDARHLRKLLDQLGKPNNPPLACTITSPPYGAVKNYGHTDQIGWGQPYDEYLVEMRQIFRALYQYTRADGSMWLIADTLRADDEGRPSDLPQRMEPLPFQLAGEAADAGWILRETLIWQKQKTLPWSSGKRFRNVFEYVLLFVKSSTYKFHSDRLRDPEDLTEWWVKWPERYNPMGKVLTNVWDIRIPQQGSWRGTDAQHVCPLPPDLVERLLLLSTDPGDIVLDPFAGTGVVVAEAERLGRRGLGIELNKQYAHSYKTIRREIRARGEHDPKTEGMQAVDLHGRIVKLRALKYAKVLWQKLSREPVQQPQFIVVQAGKITPDTMSDSSTALHVRAIFVYDDSTSGDLHAIQVRLKEFANRAPAAKFGIDGDIVVVAMSELAVHLKRERLFLYERGHTWNAVRQVRSRELPELRAADQVRKGQYRYPPIVGNVEVHETPGMKP